MPARPATPPEIIDAVVLPAAPRRFEMPLKATWARGSEGHIVLQTLQHPHVQLTAWVVVLVGLIVAAAAAWRYLRRHLRKSAQRGQWRKTGGLKRISSSIDMIPGEPKPPNSDPHHFFDEDVSRATPWRFTQALHYAQ